MIFIPRQIRTFRALTKIPRIFARQAHYLAVYIVASTILLAQGCIGPFAGRRQVPQLTGPPSLRGEFDSIEATARLTWGQAPRRGFLRYEIQRSDGGDFSLVAQTEAADDTSYVDAKLRADVAYRYRVASYFGGEETEHALLSTVVEGGIHRYVNGWPVGEPEEAFLPTRLAIDSRGVVAVAGAGSGRVVRFDRAGQPLDELTFTTEPLACLAAGALDGPSLALDSEGNLYVIYNVRRDSGRPQAFWSKYNAAGERLWTRPLEGLFARHIAVGDDDQIYVESISQLQQFDRNGERQKQYLVPALLVASLRFWSGRFAALIEPLTLVEGDWQAPRLVLYEGMERATPGLVIGRDPASPQDQGDGLLQRPTDFVVDEASQRSFVVNAGLQRVEVFRDARFSTRWGEEGRRPGQFRFAGETAVIDDIEQGTVIERRVVAGGIARDREGYIYVADTFNNRLQKFQP